MHDVAEFLHRRPPFDDLDEGALEALASRVEVEYFPAGERIFRQQEEPLAHVRVVRRGSVELVDKGRVLDLLGEGELFGHPSMLSGQPTGFEARAAEDTLCYRLPAEAVEPLLTRPAGVRFVARSLLARPARGPAALPSNMDSAQRPASALVREQPVIIEPSTTVREAAAGMGGSSDRAVLVALGEGRFGILTGSDMRRVVTEGVSADAPVTALMTEPAFSVGPERLGADVTLEMLTRGIRHVPVISGRGEVVGVLSDTDLLAAQTHTPFVIRRAIDRAGTTDELKALAGQLRPAVVSLHDARVAPAQVGSTLAIVADAVTRRLAELAVGELGAPPSPLGWLALGSQGRREFVPSSDVDSALVWKGADDDQTQRDYMHALGGRVVAQLAEVGFVADTHGVNAAKPLFGRSMDAWRRSIRHAIENPDADKGLILISLLFDGRSIYAVGDPGDVHDEFRITDEDRGLLRLMLRLALLHRPPTGFLRDFVVERSGEHRGRLDIKHGGVLPVTSIARYASLAAGVHATSTAERLKGAVAAGTLEPAVANTLQEAFDLFSALRLEHQVEQIRGGVEPGNFVDPSGLNSLTRRYLRDAFGEVRSVQRKLERGLSVETAFG